jgi:hypothetical protein
MSTKLLIKALEEELPGWKVEDLELDAGIRKVHLTKRVASVTIYLSVVEGEEGFEVHSDWQTGFCRDSFRGFTSINAEKAIKSAVARATILEELGKHL